MSVGLLARADDGGLGNQTWEFYRHVAPEATLVVEMGARGRGVEHFERYPDGRVVSYPIPRDDLRWLCNKVDVVFTCEVPYSPDLFDVADEYGCAVVVQSNPELLEDLVVERADEIWLPTNWHYDLVARRVRAAGRDASRVLSLVPVPVDLDRYDDDPLDRRRRARPTFVHVGAPAVWDRNGSEIVAEALRRVEHDVDVIVYGTSEEAGVRGVGHATIDFRDPVDDYWRLYDDGDVLVLPRRYGGLCLPMQEAAAAGLALLVSDVEPQAAWLPPDCLVGPASVDANEWMKGGAFAVSSIDPGVLARRIDDLACDWRTIDLMRDAAWAWAKSISWDTLGAEYEARLRP